MDGTAQERIYRHQHAAEVMRARSILAVACMLWLFTGVPIDVFTHRAIGTGPLAFVLIARGLGTVYHGIVLALLYRSPLPSPRASRALIASVFPVSSFSMMLIATHMGGLTSPYAIVLCVGILVQVTALPGPWRRGATLVAATVGIYPIGMLVATRYMPQLDVQLHDAAARTQFIVFVSVLLAGAIVVAWAGHVLWSLRRSVFESRNLGRYRLVARIGKGGMGEVWRAQDRALHREVALKILSPEHGRDPGLIARFEREIQATSEVAHQNVIRIHDWGVTDDGVWYYAMDLLHGLDLAACVRLRGPMPPALVVQLGLGAAAGLAEAHRRGVIHRDLKPGNLFVVVVEPGPGGENDPATGEPIRLELLDFGIARVEVDSELTQAGAILGTPAFMAPELLDGVPGDVSTDVYGLAAALYFAVTGSSPRDANHQRASTLAAVPAELDDLLARALDADRSKRPASADELGRALSATNLAWTGSWPIDQAPPELEATVDQAAPTTVAAAVRPVRS